MFGFVFKKLSLLQKRYTVNGQKNFSRALKWGIVRLCISPTFGDMYSKDPRKYL